TPASAGPRRNVGRVFRPGMRDVVRFDQVDARVAWIDVRFDELKAQLRAEIETVDGRVKLVYDGVIAQRADNQANAAAHQESAKRLDDHDLRLVAIERRASS